MLSGVTSQNNRWAMVDDDGRPWQATTWAELADECWAAKVGGEQ